MGKAANLLGDVRSLSPDQRIIGKPLHALFQLLDEPIRVFNVISCNLHPDIGKIALGGLGKFRNLQSLFTAFSFALPARLMRITASSSNGVDFPASSARSPSCTSDCNRVNP
jgi:hypothetical protein